MTREEAIKLLTQYIDYDAETPDYYKMEEACKVAIEVLEQEPCEGCDYKEWLKGEVEPFINKPCVSSGVCEHDKQKVLDKIRAEIHATAELHEDGDYYLRDEWIDEIFDDYKAESEGKE